MCSVINVHTEVKLWYVNLCTFAILTLQIVLKHKIVDGMYSQKACKPK